MIHSVVQLLDRTAARVPDNIAVEDENGALTYAALREHALRVAAGLVSAGVGVRAPVAVLMDKGRESVACFQGILYSGNFYVPLDEKAPPARLEKILQNLSPRFVIADERAADQLRGMGFPEEKILLLARLLTHAPDRAAADDRLRGMLDTDPVYVKYTSGSTGMPKGVIIPHRGVLDYAAWVADSFSITEAARFGNQAPFYFDNSILDIYACLLTGAAMHIIPEVLFQFPGKLPVYLREHRIDSIFWVPTVLMNVARSGALDTCALPNLRRVLFCGEPMPSAALNVWKRSLPECLFANLYGPTEITDACTCYMVDRAFADHEPLPIGFPCRNTRVLILLPDGTEAPPNEIGELCVLGSGVALGYWNNPEATGKGFVDNPLNPFFRERMYRTGDLARRDENGLLWCLGRMDSQIKHKGNRIELGEIETAARALSGISNACALYDGEKQQIVLHYESAAPLPHRELTRRLSEHLPAYMLPGRSEAMPVLPLNANGKIDRAALRRTLEAR